MGKFEGMEFEDAKSVANGAAAARRDASKIEVKKSGASRGNTEAKLLAIDFVSRQGGDPNNFQFTYKANQSAGIMALYLTKPGDTGVMNVTQYRNGFSFHAGACFADFPKLRPATNVDCFVEESKDAKGAPCLMVHVIAGTPTRTVKRKKQDKEEPTEEQGSDDET